MVLSTVGFISNDSVTKYISSFMNIGQVMLLRGIIATALIALLAFHRRELTFSREALHPLMLLRSLAEVASTICFLTALTHLPLANASALFHFLPLATTMTAALFLGETVGWRRWLSIFAGLIGVLLIVQPGADQFNAFSLLVLASVGFSTLRDLATARAPATVPPIMMSVVTSALVTLAGGFLVVPYGGWTPVEPWHFILFMMGAILVLTGYQGVILAMRTGELSFVASFRYVGLVYAFLLGYVVFGEVPNALMFLGSAIVLASGIYMLYRERVRGGKLAAQATASPGVAPDGL